MTDVIVRVAPSPTGYLHVGNARAALLNYLFAHHAGGKFMLRIDDTDDTRSKPEFEAAILEDLKWLGLTHDIFARQSDRADRYREAAERLKTAGRLYPCYETAAELDRRRKRQMAAGKPPVYDRAALNLTTEQRDAFEAEGRKPHWRFKLSHDKVRWNDLIRGPVEIDTATLSDPVLIREDGRFLYTLPSVVDDAEFAVSHILRGEDHVTNSAPQIEIFEALGAPVPRFAHFALFVAAGGEVLSKREGSLSLRTLRDEGIEALALNAYLARIGTSDSIEPALSLHELAGGFAFEKMGRALAHFDMAELTALNAKTLHAMPYDIVASRLMAMGVEAAVWEAVKPNVIRLADASELQKLVTGPVTPVIEDKGFATRALALLPPEPWDESTWGAWTKAVAAETGAKGRALFHPLRLALTGLEHGPELKKLLPLIGRARTLARLEGKTA
ncbi:MAG: glutamate--tRNA ligase [Pseudomonadota bacterium]